jgi:serine phosphatase RsbU (regulator of sigma subunit)
MFNEQRQQYGKERMQNILKAHHASPAAQIAAALEADLARFRGAENTADDVTFVIVKFRS